MDGITATLKQRYNCNLNFTTSSPCRYYDIAPTLHHLCKERKMWTFHGHIVTFAQLNSKFPKIAFERLRDSKNNKLQSFSLKLRKKNFPGYVQSILKITTFKEYGVINHFHKEV